MNELMNIERTNLTIEETDDRVTINGLLAVDVFIIPNRSRTLAKFMMDDKKIDIIQLCVDNNVNIDLFNDRIAETWMVTEGGDNIKDHGMLVESNGERYYLSFFGESFSNIPVKFFKDHKEGDHVRIRVTRYDRKLNDKRVNCDITVDMCLAQSKYRYRSFGNFEDVLTQI